MGRPRSEERQVATKANADVQQIRSTRRGREQAKRAQLRAELQHELEQPLTPGVKLTKSEREQERARVHTGAIRQSVWPRTGSGRTSAGDL